MAISDVTTGLNGTGVFDVLMTSITEHLTREFDANRIVGNNFAQAYIALMSTALQTSTDYELRLATNAADIALKVQQGLNTEAETLLTQAKVNELNTLLPLKDDIQQAELDLLGKQEDKLIKDTALTAQQVTEMVTLLPLKDDLQQAELNILAQQKLKLVQDTGLVSAHITKSTSERLSIVANTDLIEGKVSLIPYEKLSIEANTRLVDSKELLTDVQRFNTAANTDLIEAKILVTASEKLSIEAQTDVQEADALLRGVQKLKIEEETDLLQQQHLEMVALLPLKDNIQQAELDMLVSKNNLLFVEKADVEQKTKQSKEQERLLVDQGNLLTAQALTEAQNKLLVTQRTQTELAQVKDTVSTGMVSGVIGKQKDLYAEQKTGYVRDGRIKVAQLHADIAAIQYNTDESYPTGSNGLSNGEISSAIAHARNSVA